MKQVGALVCNQTFATGGENSPQERALIWVGACSLQLAAAWRVSSLAWPRQETEPCLAIRFIQWTRHMPAQHEPYSLFTSGNDGLWLPSDGLSSAANPAQRAHHSQNAQFDGWIKHRRPHSARTGFCTLL